MEQLNKLSWNATGGKMAVAPGLKVCHDVFHVVHVTVEVLFFNKIYLAYS
jgi:hypothetical protein